MGISYSSQKLTIVLKRAIWILIIILTSSGAIKSQALSEDPQVFLTQATALLERGNSEAYKKVSYDFNNVWTTNLTSEQQQSIISLAKKMEKKGYKLHPHFRHFFAYLAFAVTQAGVQRDELNEILEINHQVLQTLGYDQYKEFLWTMNIFLGDRYLDLTKTLRSRAEGGSKKFKMLDEVIVEEEEIEEEPLPEIVKEPLIVEEPVVEASADDWGSTSTDSWGNDDGWGSSTDSWGDDSWGSNDDWGTPSTDSWGDETSWDSSTDDAWGSEESWGTSEAEIPEPVIPDRPEVSPVITNYAMMVKMRYNHPVVQGPVLELNDVQLMLITRYDSMIVDDVDGNQLLGSKMFVGSKGTVAWPPDNQRNRGAKVSLSDFSVRVDRGDFWTPNATLTFPGKFTGETEGSFKWKSIRRPVNSLSSYPIFKSYDTDVTLELDPGRVTYSGGIELRGNQLFGSAESRAMGTLTILDERGRTVIFRSRHFEIQDSVVTSANAAFTLLDGTDSIFHPSVSMEYIIPTKQLVAVRTKQYNATPFRSTYYSLAFGVDQIRWNMQYDSLDLNISQGKDLVPATFESDDFFNPVRFKRLAGQWGFHPIVIAVNYCRKYQIDQFNTLELSNEYGVDIRLINGAMKMLEQYNFCEYDNLSGTVVLFDKAFHYYDASAQKVDYDNLFIPSHMERASNATLRLDSGEIFVRGVEKFFITADWKIAIMPSEEEVTIEQGRSLVFNGELEAGDFDYKGKDFHFNYDEFVMDMPQIDSIRISIPIPDSIPHKPGEKMPLANHLTETSGVLYIDRPDNKSGLKDIENYPYFISNSEAVVYFDGQEVLDGAYDKSVKFIVPPLEVDDTDTDSASAIFFPGSFNSGGIFPTFEDTLSIQSDLSLGFVHNIPKEGYNLYGTPAKTYEKIYLSNRGIRGGGIIDFLNSQIHSADFIYYPDSVTADGHYGIIRPGQVGTASFPEAEMGRFRMYWLPRKDSMYLQTVEEPFKFYNATAELTGKANITQGGVYGSGEMLTRGSLAKSNNMAFEEFRYSAQHARFEVLSDDPEKPAMAGDDIRLNFDLQDNIADVHPEQAGVAAISFPYAQMKTSITNAVWALEDSIITMTKPENVPIEDSYFYSTLPELDSLSFNGEQAIYDITSYELNIKGIPYIEVADARIVPDSAQTTIGANSVLQTFKNAEILFDYPEAIHRLTNGLIDIRSRNAFSGKAMYQLPVQEDTFEIEMSNFYWEEYFSAEGLPDSSTVASGSVDEASHLDVAPGFLYKGAMKLVAHKQALELAGYVKPDFRSIPGHFYWIGYDRKDDETEVIVDINNSTYETGERVLAGIHYGNNSGALYTTMIEKRVTPGDDDFFVASGIFKYLPEYASFIIEDPGKTTGENYEGQTLIYSDSTQNMIFEGDVTFINPDLNPISIRSAGVGTGNREANEYELEAFLAMELGLATSVLEQISVDVLDIVERLGNPVANDLSENLMLNVSNIIGEEATREYEENSLKDYVSLVETSQELNRSLVISNVDFTWSNSTNSWYSTGAIGLSNIGQEDINAQMDGYMEFKKDDTGGDVMNLFFQAAPGSWYFFSYQENSLLIYTSNRELNAEIAETSNFGKARVGELVFIAGEENETLKFINDFRGTYLGIDDPYNLVYPDDVSLDDSNFETIEKDDDDGFGF